MDGSELGPVFIARHGETKANRERRYAGRAADGLTDKGRLQIKSLATRLAREEIGVIWASELPRARQSADIIGERLHLAVASDPRLNELLMGPWEGLVESEVARRYPAEYRLWLEAPDKVTLDGRETLEDVSQRIVAVI